MSMSSFFQEMYNRHHKALFALVGTYFADKDVQKDVCQEVMVHIFEKMKTLTLEDLEKWNSLSWLKVVTKNYCISLIRKDKKNISRFTDDQAMENKMASSPYLDQTQPAELLSIRKVNISKALLQLKDEYRNVLILRYYKGMSIKQIDESLGINNSAMNISRAVAKLKVYLSVDDFYLFYDLLEIEDE